MTKVLLVGISLALGIYFGTHSQIISGLLALVPSLIYFLYERYPENGVLKLLLSDWGGVNVDDGNGSERYWKLSLRYILLSLFLALLFISLKDVSDPIKAAESGDNLSMLDTIVERSRCAPENTKPNCVQFLIGLSRTQRRVRNRERPHEQSTTKTFRFVVPTPS